MNFLFNEVELQDVLEEVINDPKQIIMDEVVRCL